MPDLVDTTWKAAGCRPIGCPGEAILAALGGAGAARPGYALPQAPEMSVQVTATPRLASLFGEVDVLL